MPDKKPNADLLKGIEAIVGRSNTISHTAKMQPYCKGFRFGVGEAAAVVQPGNLLEIWQVLEICVAADAAVIMQAANTGLTGGSTPNGNDYDRPVVIINTMRIDQIHVINDAKQIVGLAGSTLFGLEDRLRPYGREPHSVIGSSSIGASIVGGVCNNSGGALIHRGPAFTEMALFAQVNAAGELSLVNHLGIELGDTPEDILTNLQQENYTPEAVQNPDKRASDQDYPKLIRDVDADTPARYNHDDRLLFEAAGCAGKLAVFAVRLDTYPLATESKIFYIGCNSSDTLSQMRRDMLQSFEALPISGEYLNRDYYDLSKKYGKDTFFVVNKLGSKYIPKLFALKRKIDRFADGLPLLPGKFSERAMQLLSVFLPNQLPKKMEAFRDQYKHHFILETSDAGAQEARQYLDAFFAQNEGGYFACTKDEGDRAMLHRFVTGGAVGRYHALNSKRFGPMMTLDVALRRNERDWLKPLPLEIEENLAAKFCSGHLFCHVMHQNYIVKKGADAKMLKQKLLEFYDTQGAEYPSEHNVGNEYSAKSVLRGFYKSLDPTNFFNPGIGKTSKRKNWADQPGR